MEQSLGTKTHTNSDLRLSDKPSDGIMGAVIPTDRLARCRASNRVPVHGTVRRPYALHDSFSQAPRPTGC